MQKLYPKGPGTIDVDYGISIRTLYERCPELEIETKVGKEYIEGVISYRGRNLYFVMDQNEVIHKFSCYDDENNRVIKFICDRLRVDWIKEEEYEKLVDKKDNLYFTILSDPLNINPKFQIFYQNQLQYELFIDSVKFNQQLLFNTKLVNK